MKIISFNKSWKVHGPWEMGKYILVKYLLIFFLTLVSPHALATGVGIGIISPVGPLAVSPLQYSTGTASQAATTITGVGTTFTAAMVGSQFVFANGVSAGTITAFGGVTSLTVSVSQAVGSQAYTINYTGLNVNSTGNVGIGTTSPTTPLYVQGNVTLTDGGSGPVTLSPYSPGTNPGLLQISGGMWDVNNGYYYLQDTNAPATPTYSFKNEPGTGMFDVFGSHILGFSTNGAEAMRILSNGNVGIGTILPGQSLVVNGNTVANNYASPVQTIAYAASVTWTLSSGSNAAITLTGNTALSISGAVAGQTGLLVVTQDAAGNRTLTLPASSKVISGAGGIAYLSTAANAVDIMTFYYDGTSYYWNIGRNYN